MKIGRNEPCPCGSGKKYKKCCMQTQEGRDKVEHGLRDNIFSFSVEPRFKDELKEAMDIFFEGREPDDGGKIGCSHPENNNSGRQILSLRWNIYPAAE